VGDYSLVFRVDKKDGLASSFALDNVFIASCNYTSTTFSYEPVRLSLSCSFDDLTMCGLKNYDGYYRPTHNFTVATGQTISYPELGPTHDHTTNSSSGGFLYWDHRLPFTGSDSGNISPSESFESNAAMCIRFAYYVKSSRENRNATTISLLSGGCYGATLWYQYLDDSQGWQTITVSAPNYACTESFYFAVNQQGAVPVSVAFDDIEIGQCHVISSTTSTTTTATTTTMSTTTHSTTAMTTMTTTVSTTVKTTLTITTTTITLITTTSQRSSSPSCFTCNRFVWTFALVFLRIIVNMFNVSNNSSV
jgi:hypothetical protein